MTLDLMTLLWAWFLLVFGVLVSVYLIGVCGFGWQNFLLAANALDRFLQRDKP